MPAENLETLRFDTDPNDMPFTEPIVRRGSIATFATQVDINAGKDADFLKTLTLGNCAYGACDFPIYPFVCELPDAAIPPTGRDILRAVKAKNFRSQHIHSLDRTYIPYPGYHAYTENDEVHNDFKDQGVFSHENNLGENDGTHGTLKRYVAEGRLWYVLLHTAPKPYPDHSTPKPHKILMFSDYVILFVLGKSPHANRCVGVVTHQLCHNYCD